MVSTGGQVLVMPRNPGDLVDNVDLREMGFWRKWFERPNFGSDRVSLDSNGWWVRDRYPFRDIDVSALSDQGFKHMLLVYINCIGGPGLPSLSEIKALIVKYPDRMRRVTDEQGELRDALDKTMIGMGEEDIRAYIRARLPRGFNKMEYALDNTRLGQIIPPGVLDEYLSKEYITERTQTEKTYGANREVLSLLGMLDGMNRFDYSEL